MRRKILTALAVAGAVGALWADGLFDPVLANGKLPLNAYECAVTITGDTMCGRKLDTVRTLQRQTERETKREPGPGGAAIDCIAKAVTPADIDACTP